MATHCSHCGTKLPDEAHFCLKCAAPVTTDSEGQELLFFAAITAEDMEKVKALLMREPSLNASRQELRKKYHPLSLAIRVTDLFLVRGPARSVGKQ